MPGVFIVGPVLYAYGRFGHHSDWEDLGWHTTEAAIVGTAIGAAAYLGTATIWALGLSSSAALLMANFRWRDACRTMSPVHPDPRMRGGRRRRRASPTQSRRLPQLCRTRDPGRRTD
jgi:hypothetical protein